MAAAAAAAAVGGEEVDAGRPAVARVRALLGRRCRATLADGRALEGALHCADKQGNIILTDTVETRSAPEGAHARRPSDNGGLAPKPPNLCAFACRSRAHALAAARTRARTRAGTLAAVDGSLRTLCVWLTRALTPRTGSNAAETTQTRTLGMVLIPDKHRVGFEVEATDEERLEWMSLGD